MVHGTEGYFVERARFERRLSLICVLVSAVGLALLGAGRLPPLRRALREVPIERWGFEGPDQFVRRIVLESAGPTETAHRTLGPVEPLASRRGGAELVQAAPGAPAEPVVRHRFVGPGESDFDLLARARALYPNAPVIRSQELVIDKLVRPRYPEEAREKGVEGKVALVALVDTAGRVVEVQVMGGSG